MGSNRVTNTYRKIDRGVRRRRRKARSFRAAMRGALAQSLGLRLAVLAVLVVAAVGSVIHMSDVNAAVTPLGNMKWFMQPGAVQVAAPPLAGESFEEAAPELEEQEVPEEWRDIEEDPEEEEPAEGENLAAGFFSLLPRALAEEQTAGLPPVEDLYADDETWDEVEEGDAPEAGEDDAAFSAVPLPGGGITWDDLEKTTPLPTPTAVPAPAPTARQPKAVSLTISAVGDCTLGGDVHTGGHKRFDKVVKKKGYGYFLSRVKGVFAKDDLTIVNLEGPLTNQKKARVRKMYTFRGRPSYARILKAGSVEICNIANNHALDFDTAGLKDTVKALDLAGIGSSGFGKVYTTRVKGVRVCSMGFTKWQYTPKEIYREVKAQRKGCDLLIVSIHWGEEGVYKTSKEQRAMAVAAIEGGADLVLGHHPHVFGGIEKYKGKYIVYSLSNFCFGGNRNPADKRTFIFQQTFTVSAGGVKDGGINIVPCAVTLSRKGNDYRPSPMPKSRAKLLLKNIAKLSNLKWNKVKWMSGAYPVKAGLVKKK